MCVASPPLVEELLSKRITPEEAQGVVAIVNAWGMEPGGDRTQADLRAELRVRVLAYLQRARAPYHCHRCGAGIQSVFYIDANDRELCRSCFDASRPPVKCEHCPLPCPPDDRTPTAAGGFAHTACALKLSNAFAAQRAAGGAGLVFVRGGRS